MQGARFAEGSSNVGNWHDLAGVDRGLSVSVRWASKWTNGRLWHWAIVAQLFAQKSATSNQLYAMKWYAEVNILTPPCPSRAALMHATLHSMLDQLSPQMLYYELRLGFPASRIEEWLQRHSGWPHPYIQRSQRSRRVGCQELCSEPRARIERLAQPMG